MKLKYFGHACFSLETVKGTFLFDPFFTDNPFAVAQASDIKSCDYILISHGHFDHLGDGIALAQNTGATIISTAEIARLAGESGCKTHGMHVGGKHVFDFGYVRITPALHGAGIPGGLACGFILRINDITLYFAGDTGLFGDMALLRRLESIDYALLPIGDNYTMGPSDALEAVGMLNPGHVIPMHYNTWPIISQNPETFKKAVEGRFSIPVHVVAPGQVLPLE